jgi:dehydrogenase/reductase SDR family protein 7B
MSEEAFCSYTNLREIPPGRTKAEKISIFAFHHTSQPKPWEMSYFSNKTIWITGASSGIGEALVRQLAKEQVNLVISSRKEAELLRVQKENGLTDETCLILPLDLAASAEVGILTQKAISRFGKIDILINNGGVSQRSFALDTPLAVDRQIMEVNFFGTVALTKSLLPFMIAQQGGKIVVISSITGKFGFYLRSAYAASKHALHGFFESIRLELREKNISVLIVCPGKIATNISMNAMTSSGEANRKMDPGLAKATSAESCAKQILDGISSGKKEIYIGNRQERLAVRLKQIFPNFFFRRIAKQKIE